MCLHDFSEEGVNGDDGSVGFEVVLQTDLVVND